MKHTLQTSMGITCSRAILLSHLQRDLIFTDRGRAERRSHQAVSPLSSISHVIILSLLLLIPVSVLLRHIRDTVNYVSP